jgi:hypothetical protein
LVKEGELRKDALAVLERCVQDVPRAKVRPSRLPSWNVEREIDFTATLTLPSGKEVPLLVELKTSGQPKPVRDAVNWLLRARQQFPDAYPIVMAPYVSPHAAETCKQEGVGYVDLAGNCRLALEQLYIEKEGRPNPFTEKRFLRSLYSPRATRVLRVLLLSATDKKWRLEPLAREAGVSLGQVANVKTLLDERDWLRIDPAGLRLSDPEALLREWAETYDYRRNRASDFYAMKDIAETEEDLGRAAREQKVRFALTGFSAGARLAPAVRYQRVTAYVADGIDDLAQAAGLRRVPTGANVTLLTPYDQGVFYGMAQDGDELIVSPVQEVLGVGFMPLETQRRQNRPV